ncbi:factor-independent urate hydroxylase [Haloechinothrix sp. LS1_15]|uniref:factor-independent urate hydroxylase n=1 Tax=Haloechinothrix sp. LS1_15 TaxID=2652248 RepID=UPI002944A46D|nr:urate oxidase [Haloechinothrix sp. LS1_15]MDV6013806.1 urate oxidase [Haloechinothrix sp. LS1_15]
MTGTSVRLGANRYGKAETRVVALRRDSDRHEITDVNVSIALSGELAATHLTGDNAAVLPTDTQKNTVYAFAKKYGIDQPETFALLLAERFVAGQPTITHARVAIESYGWQRVGATGHSFARTGPEVRTCVVHHDAEATHVVSGVSDLVLLNSTDSEFWGYLVDEYTTLAETTDRILATAVTASWRHADLPADPAGWEKSYTTAKQDLIDAFAETYSYSLQQTLYAMGQRVLDNQPGVCEARLSLPNKHHFPVDLTPFGLDNDGEVFFAADRPYGLIEGTVIRDDAPAAGQAWE